MSSPQIRKPVASVEFDYVAYRHAGVPQALALDQFPSLAVGRPNLALHVVKDVVQITGLGLAQKDVRLLEFGDHWLLVADILPLSSPRLQDRRPSLQAASAIFRLSSFPFSHTAIRRTIHMGNTTSYCKAVIGFWSIYFGRV